MKARLMPVMLLLGTMVVGTQAQWQAKTGPLMTRWAQDVSPSNAHPDYPRPQMVRAEWQNLNGLWDYAVRPKEGARPCEFDGQILVPFPLESALSGVMQRIDETQRLWYRRTFEVPSAWSGRHVLLQFGAVDWEATVWVNGQELGTHRGGYDPFTFDVTGVLHPAGPQELIVAVWDPTDAGPQPRGKQVLKPEGIWYTPTSGIWQTVWLEPVAAERVEGLKITPDVDRSRVTVTLDSRYLACSDSVDVIVLDDGGEVAKASGGPTIEIAIPSPKLWSPESPFLYELRIVLHCGVNPALVCDQVTSYFGLRKIAVGKDKRGVARLLLNNRPYFMFGPLDQGFWPDGLYTAPTDEALRYDIEMTRRLGCNLARKHVKVEPERWYYWCDKLGLLVWQDMPSGDRIDAPADYERPAASAGQFTLELRRVIEALRNHPCIVMWVPFNEGWGQYDTAGIAALVAGLDGTRLVDSASGWHDQRVGDVHDIHVYPGPGSPEPEPARAAVLGEFGGLGMPIKRHTWQAAKNWGYRSFYSQAELTEAYVNLLNLLRPMTADPGLSAAIYTQTTDVEVEVNGWMTYDRAVVKVDPERMAGNHARLYLPPPKIQTIIPTSQMAGLDWCYTTDAPARNWYEPGFADSDWTGDLAGFGREKTPGITVRTAWHTPDIWLRRCFELSELPTNPHLRIFHDEDCEVFINGQLAALVEGYSQNYVVVPMMNRTALQPGANLMAVHCRQTSGGQGIDVGLVDLIE